MKQVNAEEVPWEEQRSPMGRYHTFRRHLSLAMGAPRDAGVAGGGHPFDIEMVRIPAGGINCPFHAHSSQWEVYLVLSGSGEVRCEDGAHPIRPGDAFTCPPNEAHQVRNTGAEDLIYYVIADNPPSDVIRYPDSGKWAVKPEKLIFRMAEANYYDGEE